MSDREKCEVCGGIMMGPIYWVDEAPKDQPICRRGRVVFSGDYLDCDYDCQGKRIRTVEITILPYSMDRS